MPSTIVVTSLANSGRGTLRAAIIKADHETEPSGGPYALRYDQVRALGEGNDRFDDRRCRSSRLIS